MLNYEQSGTLPRGRFGAAGVRRLFLWNRRGSGRMASQKLKDKIIQFMKADIWNKPKNIDNFTLLVAHDYRDQNDPRYLFLLIDALCELESEGKVRDMYQYDSGNIGKKEKIRNSLWMLRD